MIWRKNEISKAQSRAVSDDYCTRIDRDELNNLGLFAAAWWIKFDRRDRRVVHLRFVSSRLVS